MYSLSTRATEFSCYSEDGFRCVLIWSMSVMVTGRMNSWWSVIPNFKVIPLWYSLHGLNCGKACLCWLGAVQWKLGGAVSTFSTHTFYYGFHSTPWGESHTTPYQRHQMAVLLLWQWFVWCVFTDIVHTSTDESGSFVSELSGIFGTSGISLATHLWNLTSL